MKTCAIQHSKSGKSQHTRPKKQGFPAPSEARKYLYSSIVDVGEDFLWDRVFRFSLPKSAEQVKIAYVEKRPGIKGSWRFTLSYLIDEVDHKAALPDAPKGKE